MIVEINIKKVIVLVREVGMDKVIIQTHNLSPTVFPYDELGSMVMAVSKNKGEQYVIDNFGVIPDVINV